MLFGKDMRKWALLSATVLLAYSLCFTRAGAESITEDLKKCDGEAENHVIAGEVNSTEIDHSQQTITTQVNDEDKQIHSTQSLVGNEGQGTSEKYGEYVFTVIDTEQVVVKSSTAFMPVRQAIELCGIQHLVDWDSAKRCAYITCGKGRIKAGDGKSYITLDGEYKSLGSSCYIEDSTLFVPLRSFAEHLGTYIIWSDSSALAVRIFLLTAVQHTHPLLTASAEVSPKRIRRLRLLQTRHTAIHSIHPSSTSATIPQR